MSYRTERQASYLAALTERMQKAAVEAQKNDVEGAEEFVEAARNVVDALAAHDEAKSLTKENASKAIDYIIAATVRMTKATARVKAARKTAGSSAASTEYVAPSYEVAAGMYRIGSEIIRVYLGQQSGQMLAKKIVSEGTDEDGKTIYTYQYMGKASRFVKASTPKLSLVEAKVWGKMTGTCCVCAARLDNPESVDAGIGPVCAKKHF